MIHSAEISYNISINGTVVADITCLNGTTIIIKCTNNIWNNYTPNMCENYLENCNEVCLGITSNGKFENN